VNRRLGWTVRKCYHFVSAAAGGLAIFVLLVFTELVAPKHQLPFFFLIVSSGFMQLYSGDVENYTMLSVMLLVYFLSAYLYVSGRTGVVVPSAALSLALCFHLLAGWILPSLLYLYLVAAKRRQYAQIVLSMAVFASILAGTVLFFHVRGILPIDQMMNSHAFGRGIGFWRKLVEPSVKHYWGMANLLFLMFPWVLLLIPLVRFRRIEGGAFNGFLIASTLSMLVFMSVWDPWLTVYYDWNLFAPATIPLAILVYYNYSRVRELKHKASISWAMFCIAALHSYSWIVSNHYWHP